MWSPQEWWTGWFPASKVRVEVNLNPQHGNTPACPVSAEQVGCAVAKAVPAGRVCWPQWCRLELSVAQVLLKQIELPCPCNSVEHTRGLTLRLPWEQKWSGSADGVLCLRKEGYKSKHMPF